MNSTQFCVFQYEFDCFSRKKDLISMIVTKAKAKAKANYGFN